MPPRVVITGGAGFLGFHLVQRFLKEAFRVRVLDMVPCPPWAAGVSVEYRRGDIRDPASVVEALKGAEVAVHAAFASPRESGETIGSVNVEGTGILCREALDRGVRRLILVSSTIVRSSPKTLPPWGSAALARLNLYRSSRIEAERIAMEYAGRGLSAAIVRPKTFIGPGRISAFGIVFDWIRHGQPVLILGNGHNRYQLLDIRDMAEGIWRLESSTADGVFHFGAEQFGSVGADLQTLVEHAKTGARLCFVPAAAARALLRAMELANLVPLSEWHYMSAWGKDSVVDLSRAQQELGWHATRSNSRALIEAYDWYASSLSTTGTAQSTHPLPLSHRLLKHLIRMIPSWG